MTCVSKKWMNRLKINSRKAKQDELLHLAWLFFFVLLRKLVNLFKRLIKS
ncbi:hypothetical protein HMPREF3187_00950 [Aerococcus christensenii]|uniref:Uncharacterized protein n=1 Tax=Aerococcus christensenii TaxID=87541 RepID=A0A133XZC3_9LACT|nr:hypothetical protein HMPREF3187_00950 [Aerococcus christensenii]